MAETVAPYYVGSGLQQTRKRSSVTCAPGLTDRVVDIMGRARVLGRRARAILRALEHQDARARARVGNITLSRRAGRF